MFKYVGDKKIDKKVGFAYEEVEGLITLGLVAFAFVSAICFNFAANSF